MTHDPWLIEAACRWVWHPVQLHILIPRAYYIPKICEMLHHQVLRNTRVDFQKPHIRESADGSWSRPIFMERGFNWALIRTEQVLQTCQCGWTKCKCYWSGKYKWNRKWKSVVIATTITEARPLLGLEPYRALGCTDLQSLDKKDYSKKYATQYTLQFYICATYICYIYPAISYVPKRNTVNLSLRLVCLAAWVISMMVVTF